MKSVMKQFLLAGAILVAPLAMAQKGGDRSEKDPKAMAETKTARMVETLALTPDQTGRVREINLRHAEKMHALRTESKDDMEARKASMNRLRDEHKAELKEVLTPEQFQRMDTAKPQPRQKGRTQEEAAPGQQMERTPQED